MNRSTTSIYLTLLFSFALIAAACDDDDESTPTDTSSDMTTDAPEDMSGDQTVDTTEDPTPDSTDDPVVDMADDSEEDVSVDVTVDVPADVPVDGAVTGNVFINEFIVTPNSDEAIELYNADSAPVSLNGWTIEHTDHAGTDTYNLVNGLVVPATGFLHIPSADFGLSASAFTNVGAELVIKDASGTVIDTIAYGTAGLAPAPIFQWSTARIADGVSTGDDADDFNVDQTPTMGAANDVPGNDLGGSDFVINEFFIDQSSETADFFEFHNVGTSTVDVDDYLIILAGDDFVFEANTSVGSTGFLVIDQADFPEYSELDVDGNAYLFDDTGIRFQGISWTAASTDGTDSSGFLPDGAIDDFAGDETATGLLHTLTPTSGAANAD